MCIQNLKNKNNFVYKKEKKNIYAQNVFYVNKIINFKSVPKNTSSSCDILSYGVYIYILKIAFINILNSWNSSTLKRTKTQR